MLLAETTSGLSLKFQVVSVRISRKGIIQLESFFGSILLLFLMKVGGAHTHSSQGKSLASDCQSQPCYNLGIKVISIPYSRMKIIWNIISNNLLFCYLIHERAQRQCTIHTSSSDHHISTKFQGSCNRDSSNSNDLEGYYKLTGSYKVSINQNYLL